MGKMFDIKRLSQIFSSDRISAKWAKLRKNKHFTYGLPFVILVVGAPSVLQHFGSIRYEYRNQKIWTEKEEAKLQKSKLRKKAREECTVEKIYENTVKNNEAINDYKMVRGPRPWEEPNSDFMKQIEELEEKNKGKKFKSPRALGMHY